MIHNKGKLLLRLGLVALLLTAMFVTWQYAAAGGYAWWCNSILRFNAEHYAQITCQMGIPKYNNVDPDGPKNPCDYATGIAGTGSEYADTVDLAPVTFANGFTAVERIEFGGEGGPDTVYGGGFPNFLDGGGGNDIIVGGAGEDRLVGGDDDDTINGGTGNDIINGGPGNDTIDGGAGDDELDGGDGDDTINGGAGNDIINGRPGNDNLDGGDDDDKLFGGPGNDTIDGGAGNDELVGGPGNGTLFGDAGDETLLDDDGDDTMDGGPGDDTYLIESDGADTLSDESGDDTLDFSLAPAAITIDVDLTDVDQEVDAGGNTVQLAGQFENFVGGSFSDVVFVDPLDVPRNMDGGAGDDTMNFDAQGAAVTDDGTTIIAEGFAPVTYINFETVNITNVAPPHAYPYDYQHTDNHIYPHAYPNSDRHSDGHTHAYINGHTLLPDLPSAHPEE